MSEVGFTKVSGCYEKDSLVQNSAGGKLFELVNIKRDEDVLDLACGPGHLTRIIREKTNGRVTGMDAASGMIHEATAKYGASDILFINRTAEEMEFESAFEVIFCNSAFQWFLPPDNILKRCLRALKPGGRIGIQAPATKVYSPQFIRAIGAVSQDERTKDTFSHYRSPMFFLETGRKYKELFENGGFKVSFCELEAIRSEHSLAEAIRIFKSGAAVAYLTPNYYDTPLTADYEKNFYEIVEQRLSSQAGTNGKISLLFNRIYMVAEKPHDADL